MNLKLQGTADKIIADKSAFVNSYLDKIEYAILYIKIAKKYCKI